MNQRLRSTFLALALAAGANSVWAARDVPDPVQLLAGAALTPEVSEAVDVKRASDFKGVKKVAVNSFNLVFVIGSYGSASAGKASVAARYTLQGVGAKEFQEITDKAYADFLSDLGKAGFELVTLDVLRGNPSFVKLQAAGQPTGTKREEAIAFAPNGLTVAPLAMAALARDSGLGSSLAVFSAVGSTIGSANDLNGLAQSLDATVLDVTAVIDFAEIQNTSGGLFGRLTGNNTASVKSRAAPRIVTELTSLRFFTPAQKASEFNLKKPLALPNDTFTEVVQQNSSSTTAGNIAGALLSAAIGGGSKHETKDYQVIADPAQYSLRMGDALAQLRLSFINKMTRSQ
jgi:hypothetical protein